MGIWVFKCDTWLKKQNLKALEFKLNYTLKIIII